MINCLYFTILLCVLLEQCVQKSYAYYGPGVVRRDTHLPNYSNHNGYEHHLEQYQQLPNGFQSQQTSTGVRYWTGPSTAGPGQAANANNGAVQKEYQPKQTNPSSNDVQYYSEQQQMQQSGPHPSVNPNTQYSGVQQQYQHVRRVQNGHEFNRSQYQYQNGSEQLQDQFTSVNKAPLHEAQSQRLTGEIGRQLHGRNSEPTIIRPNSMSDRNVNVTKSSEYQSKRDAQQVHPPQNTPYYSPVQNNGFQHLLVNSEHVIPPTPTPAMQNLQKSFSETEVIVSTGATVIEAPSVNHASVIPRDNIPPTTVPLPKLPKYEITCPLGVEGIYPHPFSNTHYIKCFDENLLIKSCRDGFLFSLSRKLCDINKFQYTFDTAIPTVRPPFRKPTEEMEDQHVDGEMKSINVISLRCPVGVSGKFLYPYTNTRYVKCANGDMEFKECSNGSIYSIRLKICMKRQYVDTNDYVEGIVNSSKSFDVSLGVICGPKSDGKYPHPENWRKFVVCHHGKIMVKRCPQRKVFDMDLNKCIDMD